MPREIVRVKRDASSKPVVHQGNFNQLLGRLESPTMNSNIRLLRGANKKDGYLSPLFPQNKTSVNSQKGSQKQKSFPSQEPRSQHSKASLSQQSNSSSNSTDWGTSSQYPENDFQSPSNVFISISSSLFCKLILSFCISERQNLDEEAIFTELMDAINLEVTQHAQSQKSDTVPKIKSKRKWNENVKRYEDLWATNQKELFETCIASQAVDISFCCQCEKQIFTVIRCQTCNGQYCEDCDSKFHFNHPFHARLLLHGLDALPLKPTDFIVGGKKEVISMFCLIMIKQL